MRRPFAGSHLVYGGAAGGTAYSFINGGYKYILYSISGTGVDRAGLLVQRVGSMRATTDMRCKQGQKEESSNHEITDAIIKWKPDADIELHGLPSKD